MKQYSRGVRTTLTLAEDVAAAVEQLRASAQSHARNAGWTDQHLMLLDANLLLYAVHQRSEQHDQATAWLTEKLNGAVRVGFPWQSVNAFLRISTHPRAFQRPLDPTTAWERVADWLAAPVA
jgi:hypothetical protein